MNVIVDDLAKLGIGSWPGRLQDDVQRGQSGDRWVHFAFN